MRVTSLSPSAVFRSGQTLVRTISMCVRGSRRPPRLDTEMATSPWWEPASYPRLQAYAQTHTTLIHGCVGLLWIFASDRALEWLGFDSEQMSRLQTYKGFFYVAVTTVLLYVLIDRVTRSMARVSAALCEKHRALSTLLSNLPGGVYRRAAAGDGRLEFISDGAARLFGVERDRRSNPAFKELVHPDDLAQVEARLEAALSNGQPFALLYRVRNAQGKIRWLWDQGACVTSRDGQLAIEGYLSDMTEHHLLRERLHRTQRLESLGQMASGIAHDFNNVLFAVTAGCGLLQADSISSSQREIVSQMTKASDAGQGLVEQLLAFARAQGIKPTELELGNVVRHYEPILKRLVNAKTKLRFHFSGENLKVRADATQLEQVLLNLVTNAAHALRAGGVIDIGVRAIELGAAEADRLELSAGKYVELSVADDGCGIAQDVLPHIFEPFFSTKGDEGTGLGLATVSRIVRDSGGSTTVKSELGSGTTFCVLLPAITASRPRE